MAQSVTRIWTLLAISFLAPLEIAAASTNPVAGAPATEPLERGQQIARAVATTSPVLRFPPFR